MCGIFGIISDQCKKDIAGILYYGLISLQHRGQEACGMSVINENGYTAYKHGLKLAEQVFVQTDFNNFEGKTGLSHVRYSTSGSKEEACFQPIVSEKINFSFAFNGTIINPNEIGGNEKSIDTDTLKSFIESYENIEKALENLIKICSGAFSIVVITKDKLYAARDKFGYRPLYFGFFSDNMVVSSENCPFPGLGVESSQEINPGELFCASCSNGKWNVDRKYFTSTPKFCAFEYVYFARPDSEFQDGPVYAFREFLGKQLFIETKERYKNKKDLVVMGVPDSATCMAIGFAKESGITLTEGFVKNRYIHRTFIQPTQDKRQQAIRLKYNVLKKNLEHKHVILIDDSIVRGNTIMKLIDLIRTANVKAIDILIACPPIKYSCYMGMDFKDESKLIGRNDIQDIKTKINADYLHYLSLDSMQKYFEEKNTYCYACWNGNYTHK